MKGVDADEEKLLRATALQNVESILRARQRAESDLLKTKEALEEEKRVLEILNETGAKLASTLDVQGVAQLVTDAGTRLIGAQFGAFFSAVTPGEPFTLHALTGAPRQAFERFGTPRNTAIFGPTFRGEGIVRIGDVTKDPRYGQLAPHYGMPEGHLPVCSYLAAPVLSRSGGVIGGLFFGHEKPDVFSERAERIITGIASQASIAIDNARLYEQTKRAAEERATLLEVERVNRVEIERISTMKDEFLATLSHELRTPLNAMLGWSTVLLERPGDLDLSRKGLETIARNARAQAQLIDDLLDMQRIVSGKIRLDVQKLDLVPIVEAAIESARPSAEGKSIVVRRTIDPNVGPVFGDPNRLQQVVWNLLTNAVKFTPKSGKIDVIVQRVNSHAEITVHDNGAGITSDFLPHVFERFRQGDASATRKFGGLGIGLSIVRQLVELHGGSVRVESPGKDLGTTFVVSLPLRAVHDLPGTTREHPKARRLTPIEVVKVTLGGIMVLVVDDEHDARELVESVLVNAGARVITAGSAKEAIAVLAARQEPIDVIISDIGMPECDGYQFMRDVRNLATSRAAMSPAVALTAFARSEDRTRAMLAGYQVHMSKPIEPSELVATVKSIAANRERRDS